MAKRLEVHALLESVPGTQKVYWQPPSNNEMVYPCIRYELASMETKHADNIPYQVHERYTVTVLDHDPDSAIPDAVIQLPKCSFDRVYKANNLYHFVFSLFP